MSSQPDYTRARNALAHKAQLLNITMQYKCINGAFERGFRFQVSFEIQGAPLWDGPFYMGSGHADPAGHAPTLEVADVLPSLFMDASCAENADDVLDFASEFGYATDTHVERERVRTDFASCARTAKKLHFRLFDDDYATLAQLSGML